MRLRIIDTETTGLPPDAAIVEVATVDLIIDDSTVQRDRMWSSLINPGRDVPPEASAVHHIVTSMLDEAPKIDDVMSTIVDGAPDVFVAHEAKFERAVLPKAFVDAQKWICTRKGAMTAWPDAPNFKNQTLRYWLNLKLADEALAQPHRALGDAYVTAAIMRRLMTIPGATVDEFVDITAHPVVLTKFNFGKHAMVPLKDVPTDYFDWIVNKSGFEDEDVIHTARTYLAQRRAAQRQRSPV